MSNFDFTSIAHILADQSQSKAEDHDNAGSSKTKQDDIRRRLRFFCEKLFESLSVMSLKENFKGIDGSLFLGDKKALLEKFDLFFQKLVPSENTFSNFIDCILQKSANDTDDIRFEVQAHAEKVVWDKFVYMDLLTEYEDENVTFIVEHKKQMFYLFCLFNRFAKQIPGENTILLLNSKRANYIVKRFDNSETVIERTTTDLNLRQFLEIFFSEEILNPLLQNIKAMYSEFVKDVIKEAEVICRVVPMINRHSITSFSSSLYSIQNCLFINGIYIYIHKFDNIKFNQVK